MTTTMKMTMTTTRRLTAIAILTTCALLCACGDLGSARVDDIEYEADGSLVVFMATGIHVLAPSLDRESMTIPFDGLPVNTEQDRTKYSLSADGRVAAVSFSPPMGSTEKSTITLFDMTTGTRGQTFHLDDPAPLPGGELGSRGVFSLRLSPQADLLYFVTFVDSPEPDTFAYRDTVIDVASGAVLWTRDTMGIGLPTFSADGTRLFAATDTVSVQALDPRTGASLYAGDVPDGFLLRGLSVTADGHLAGVMDPPCTDFADCAPSFASWSAADLTLLGQRSGRPKTYKTDVANARDFGAAFACSPWNGLCALGIKDVGAAPPLDLVSIMLSDGTPVRELTVPAVASLMAFAPSGDLLTIVSIHEDNAQTVQVFNVNDGTLVTTLSFDVSVR
jgi:WD40 repeat protein